MRNRILSIIFVISFLILPVNQASASEIEYFYSSGQATITTPNLGVKLTSNENVPQYWFWTRSDETSMTTPIKTDPITKNTEQLMVNSNKTDEGGKIHGGKNTYKVKFLKIFEFSDNNDNGLYDKGEVKYSQSELTLSSLSWIYSDFNVEMSGNSVSAIHFNLTHENTPYIQFRNHFYANATDQLKFDIIINNYTWSDEENSTRLAIEINFQGNNKIQNRNQNQNKTRYTMNEGFFGYNSSAESAGNRINVYSRTEGNNGIYLCYDHFGSSLVHDPEVGISGNTEEGGYGFNALLVLSGALFAAMLMIRSRRRSLKS